MPSKAKKGSPRYYFNQITENAIIRHNKETRPYIKERIYNDHIRQAFEKLAENIQSFQMTISTVSMPPEFKISKKTKTSKKVYSNKAELAQSCKEKLFGGAAVQYMPPCKIVRALAVQQATDCPSNVVKQAY